MPDSTAYEPTLRKLLEKSEEGRVPWELNKGASRTFRCQLEGGYVFETWAYEGGYGVRMLDDKNAEVFTETADEEVVLPSRGADQLAPRFERLYSILRDIYGSARRKALKVDEKLETVSSILDKI